ncbi:MAG TPA: CobW family GTP-binding protein [Bacteroidales bacterium]|nr:CobW family GTP-binding protein [Bacteroidales bacterium]
MSIPLHLVTGFLGSGKTSFLKHYLDAFSGVRKIGVIQNEFSSAGIDGAIIRQNKGVYQMMEVNNGSVFCVCLLGGFIDSLSTFVDDNQPDEIIMEASGLSDPVSIGQIFQAEKLRDKVYLGYSWTILDAKNFEKISPILSILEHQIRMADTVVINKCDLAEIDDDSGIVATVKKTNPFARIINSSFGRIRFEEGRNVFKIFPVPKDRNSYRPDIRSVVIKSSRTIPLEKLREFIDSEKENFIRCKGFVNIGKSQKVLVQSTFEDYSFEQVDYFPGVTEIIAIGNFGEVDYTRKFENYCNND